MRERAVRAIERAESGHGCHNSLLEVLLEPLMFLYFVWLLVRLQIFDAGRLPAKLDFLCRPNESRRPQKRAEYYYLLHR